MYKFKKVSFEIMIILLLIISCKKENSFLTTTNALLLKNEKQTFCNADAPFQKKLVQSAKKLIDKEVKYIPNYTKIDYPNGDVDAKTGVCTDVIIRVYRLVGIDLQEKVHTDMVAHFNLYPNLWKAKRTDTNIDHRRVPNLQVFFTRNGKKLPVSQNAKDYKCGDIVTWMIGNKLPHIGLVVDEFSADGKRPLILHNVGRGQVMEDVLFEYPITGHYLYGQ